MGTIGERSRSEPGAEGGGEVILVVAWTEVPVVDLGEAVVDVVVEDMALREARRGVRGKSSRGGATRTVKKDGQLHVLSHEGRWQRYCNHRQKSAVGL